MCQEKKKETLKPLDEYDPWYTTSGWVNVNISMLSIFTGYTKLWIYEDGLHLLQSKISMVQFEEDSLDLYHNTPLKTFES